LFNYGDLSDSTTEEDKIHSMFQTKDNTLGNRVVGGRYY